MNVEEFLKSRNWEKKKDGWASPYSKKVHSANSALKTMLMIFGYEIIEKDWKVKRGDFDKFIEDTNEKGGL